MIRKNNLENMDEERVSKVLRENPGLWSDFFEIKEVAYHKEAVLTSGISLIGAIIFFLMGGPAGLSMTMIMVGLIGYSIFKIITTRKRKTLIATRKEINDFLLKQ